MPKCLVFSVDVGAYAKALNFLFHLDLIRYFHMVFIFILLILILIVPKYLRTGSFVYMRRVLQLRRGPRLVAIIIYSMETCQDTNTSTVLKCINSLLCEMIGGCIRR